MNSLQRNLLPFDSQTAKLSHFSSASENDRGAIFTRVEVVDFILDLAGYVEAKPLASMRLLEPSAGHADFLVPVIGRLLRSYWKHGGDPAQVVKNLSGAIRAYEVHQESFLQGKRVIEKKLVELGVSKPNAAKLSKKWLVLADFLLTDLGEDFTHIVGNPPYVRQELIPDELLQVYRSRFQTLYDRADLYVPFFEHCLGALAPDGVLGFICADRWTKNKYGGPLRELVARDYALTHYVDLVGTPAFHTEVIAYPAITVISRQQHGKSPATRVAFRPKLDQKTLKQLAKAMTSAKAPKHPDVATIQGAIDGAEPWLLDRPDRLALVRRLEAQFPLVEQAGCQIGIGVATGSDRVYIAPFKELPVEPSRKIPLVSTGDIQGGVVAWKGLGVLNPFDDDGKVVDLARYPKFAAYLDIHAQAVKARNVAKRNPDRWFRTIDRIYPELAARPKLLVPDIKGTANIVFEPGGLYPHHNLYYIVSDTWDLRALQAVLLSGIARLFVATYSTVMHGGFLRFQAQYLRRIRLPLWESVPHDLRHALREAAISRDADAANRATFSLYGLTAAEQLIVLAD